MATVDKIAVELVAKMDGLQRDFGKAAGMAEASAGRMRKSFASVNTTLTSLGGALVAGMSFRWLGGLATDAIKAAGDLKDLSEQTGVAATTLARFDIAARTSDVGIDTVGKAMNRLAKGMSNVDKDSKGIPQALKAIGVDFEKFKGMGADEQMTLIAKSFDGFQDGAGKAAVAMALFGKEGAALIPFFKDLAENQDIAAGRTQEMIDAADEFDKSLKRLQVVGGDLLISTLAPMLPVLSDLAKSLVDVASETSGTASEADKLGGSTGIRDFAQSAVSALALVMNAIQVTGRGIKTLATGVSFGVDAAWTFTKRGGMVGLMADGMMGNLGNVYGAKTDAVKDQVKEIYGEVLAGDKMLAEFNARQNTVQAVERKNKDKTKIKFNTEDGKKSGGSKAAAKNEDADYDRIVKSLREKIAVQNEELTSTEKLTDAAKEYAKFQQQVADKSITLSPEQLKQAEALFAQMLDGAEKLKQKAQQKVFEAASVSLQEISAAFARDNAKAREALEIMPQSQRNLNNSMRSIDDKGRTERERLADLELKGNISKEQRIELEKKLTDVLAAQRVEIAALSETQDKLNASFEYGTEKALQSYIDEVANVAASAESLMKSAFKGMEDALVEFVTTGKLDFKSLVNSIIADMARITIRQNITGPLAQWMQGTSSGGSSGGGLGGIFSFFSGLFGGGGSSPRWDLNALGGVYASPSLSAFSGSVVNRPTAFAFANGAGLMGEAGPEAILPLKRGSNGKLGVQSGGGRAVNITVNVSGNSSAPDVRRAAGQGAREALAAFNGAGRYA